MNKTISPPADFTYQDRPADPVEEKTRKRWILALYFCTISGFSFSLVGLAMCALAFFSRIETADAINRTGTWLMAAAFPLIIFGAHAMDKIAEIDRNEKCRELKAKQRRELYYPEQWKENTYNKS